MLDPTRRGYYTKYTMCLIDKLQLGRTQCTHRVRHHELPEAGRRRTDFVYEMRHIASQVKKSYLPTKGAILLQQAAEHQNKQTNGSY